MLEEFAYLGEEKAREVVIDQPPQDRRRMVEALRLFPKHPKGEDTFQPFWPDAADNIQNMSWGTAKDWYGDPLPDIVVKRLEKELGSIIGYGFATLYNIAEQLVKQAPWTTDTWWAAAVRWAPPSWPACAASPRSTPCRPTTAAPTASYRAFSTWTRASTRCGVDLPDKDCPLCGRAPGARTASTSPLRCSWALTGDKVPDIDLNFSGEYQPVAHH